ncbi:MAG TPA: hypothetical protein VGE66_03520 [Chitinophagaceae bacterium]
MYNYSPEELLQYLYKETTPEMTASIEKALQEDWTLREKLAVLKASYERLNTLVESPRTQVVLNILRYAGTTEKVS